MLVGLDIGFGAIKWTSDGKTVHTVPTLAVPTVFEDADVWVDGQGYLVGEHAEREDPTLTSQDVSWERVDTPEFRAVLGYVLAGIPTGIPDGLEVVTGLPYGATDREEERWRTFLRTFAGPVKRGDGRTWRGPLQRVQIRRQAMAALVDAVFDEHNQPRRRELLQEGLKLALVDVGYKTTDLVTCELFPQYVALPSLSGSKNIGVVTVEGVLQAQYSRQYGTETLSRQNLRLILQQKPIYRFGNRIELPIQPATEYTVSQIKRFIESKWRDARENIARVMIAGGGGALLGEKLRSLHEHSEVLPEPQGANARGFYKLGLFAKRRGERV